MRIDLTTLGVEPPENGKTGRAAQTAGTGIVTGNALTHDRPRPRQLFIWSGEGAVAGSSGSGTA